MLASVVLTTSHLSNMVVSTLGAPNIHVYERLHVSADAGWKAATAKRDCFELAKTRTLELLVQAELAMAKVWML